MAQIPYKKYTPQITFETNLKNGQQENRNLQEIMRIQQGSQASPKLQINENFPYIKEPLNLDFKDQLTQTDEQENYEKIDDKEYQKMFEICQQLNQQKISLLNDNDELKQKILDYEKQINKINALNNIYQQESIKLKEEVQEYQRQIEINNRDYEYIKLEKLEQELIEQNQWIQELLKISINFIQSEKLDELQQQLYGEEDIKMNIQIIVEYLMNEYKLKKNQEQKYENHIRDNIQIIYDLQNKFQDITKIQTPKSQLMETLKLSKLSSTSNLNMNSNNNNQQQQQQQQQIQEYQQKIRLLKQQGKSINKKWQQFCEDVLRERHEIVKKAKNQIDRLKDQITDFISMIKDLIQQLPSQIQQKWLEILELKINLYYLIEDYQNCEEIQQGQMESNIKLIQKKISYTRQKAMSYDYQNDIKHQLMVKDQEIDYLRIQLQNLKYV